MDCLEAVEDERRLYGYSNGFVLPFRKYMHCDTIEIDQREVIQNSALRAQRLRVGLLMGAATFSYGFEKGCLTAEALAINDNDVTAQRLVKYYRYFGFQVVREVQGGWGDVGEMLIWGGVGTKMQASTFEVLSKWSPLLRGTGKKSP